MIAFVFYSFKINNTIMNKKHHLSLICLTTCMCVHRCALSTSEHGIGLTEDAITMIKLNWFYEAAPRHGAAWRAGSGRSALRCRDLFYRRHSTSPILSLIK